MAKADKLHVLARIVLVAPPSGVAFALQRGKNELARVAVSTGADLRLDFGIQVERMPSGALRFTGEFVQGPAGGKFIYVNSGTLAGQLKSPWTRRAKVSLESLKWPAIHRVTVKPGAVLEARITGVARDGGPVCASVALLGRGWLVKLVG